MTPLNTLLEITIYSAVLFGAIWLFRILLKKQLSPVMLYAMWFILIARLLMPVTIASGFSFITIPAVEQPVAYSESVDLSDMFDNTAVSTGSVPYNDMQTTQQQDALSQQSGQNTSVQSETILSSNSKLNITWQMALIALWLAGSAIMLIQIGISVLKLKKRIKTAHTIPTEWQRIAKELQKELGFKRSVRIVMIEGFPSPALCGGLKPVIVLPSEMAGKSEESIRFALLHEMTHIKRGDHIVSMLLLLLRAVYWFNPIVWLMMKQMRLDIETACDSWLTKPMSTSTKKRYAGTMLSMYAQQQIRYVLGMSLGQTKKIAERRLRGIFMRSRSSRKGKMVAILLTTVLLVTCFTTACQPTPENSIVQGKDNALDGIVEKNSAEGSGVTYTTPESWEENMELGEGRLQIEINAPIKVPSVYAYPIIRSTPGKFTMDQLNKMIKYFTGDSIIYKDSNYGNMPVSVYDGLKTKSEIQAAILQLKLSLSNQNSNVNSIKDSDPQAYQQAVDSINSQIEMLEEKYQTAPETALQTPLVIDNTVATEGVIGIVDLGKAKAAKIEINSTDSEDGRSNRFVFENKGSMVGGEPVESIETGLRNPPEISVEDALQLAQKAVNDLAGSEMQLACTAVAAYDDMLSPIRTESYLDSQQYYVFYYTRSIGGIPYTYQSNLGIGSDKEGAEYMPTYPYEYIKVGVDDTGIIEFIWRSPAEIGEVLTNSATLLSFDEIKDIFEQQIYVQQVWNESTEDVLARKIYIDKITLGMMRVINPDNSNEYLMIPVWDFFGYYVDIYPDGYQSDRQLGLNEDNERVHKEFVESMLTISAYNGTIIDRGAGY